MTHEDKASYDSTPACIANTRHFIYHGTVRMSNIKYRYESLHYMDESWHISSAKEACHTREGVLIHTVPWLLIHIVPLLIHIVPWLHTHTHTHTHAHKESWHYVNEQWKPWALCTHSVMFSAHICMSDYYEWFHISSAKEAYRNRERVMALRQCGMLCTGMSHGTTWMRHFVYREWVVLYIMDLCEWVMLYNGMSHCTTWVCHFVYRESVISGMMVLCACIMWYTGMRQCTTWVSPFM